MLIEKLLATLLFGGLILSPVSAYASYIPISSSTESVSANASEVLDQTLPTIRFSTTTEDTLDAKLGNDASSIQDSSSTTLDSNEVNISISTSSIQQDLSPTLEIASSTQVQASLELPVFIRKNIEPVPAPEPASFKVQPTLRLAPMSPANFPIIPPPVFGVIEIIATTSATTTITEASSTDVIPTSVPDTKEDDKSNLMPSVDTQTATTTASTSDYVNGNDELPAPSTDSTAGSTFPDTSATVTKTDDTTVLLLEPLTD